MTVLAWCHFTMVVAKRQPRLQYSLHTTVWLSAFILLSFSPLSFPFSLIWTHWFLIFSMGYNLFMSLIILATNIPDSAGGSPFKLALLSCDMPPNFFLSTFLPFGITKCSSFLISYLQCASPESSHFSNEPWFLLVGNSMREQGLSAKYASC